MEQPAKPFACSMAGCGMTFTNEDHLHVHTRKHDMALTLPDGKSGYLADQTPTPTRFIRNCEEVGLFQDLQNVNPFDEGFKRAIETKSGESVTEGTDDALHTPQLFPQHEERCLAITRSLSDESGTIKEYETTRISQRTNEVTISRVISKLEQPDCERLSYRNNVVTTQSYVEIKKEDVLRKDVLLTGKEGILRKDVLLTDTPAPLMSQQSIDLVVDSLAADCATQTQANNISDRLGTPVATVQSRLETHVATVPNRVLENATVITRAPPKAKKKPTLNIESNRVPRNFKDCIDPEDVEVILKLGGKSMKMKAVHDVKNSKITMEKVKTALLDKINKDKNVTPVVVGPGTLIPVKVLNLAPNTLFPVGKVAISATSNIDSSSKLVKYVPKRKRKSVITPKETPIPNANDVFIDNNGGCETNNLIMNNNRNASQLENYSAIANNNEGSGMESEINQSEKVVDKYFVADAEGKDHFLKECRSAASRRYRERQKQRMHSVEEENRHLRANIRRLTARNVLLQTALRDHANTCPAAASIVKDLLDNR